jgi:16S rRNA (cytosine967-C5)-methyltransferase
MNEYHHAITALISVVENGRSLDASFPAEITPLGKQITYGVLREFFRLDYLTNSLLKKPLQTKHLDLELLLFCGIYSIQSLNRPSHASVNAVVDTTRLLKKEWAKGLINAVLRNYIRKRDQIDLIPEDNIEATTNHPAWLLDKFNDAWPDHIQQIIQANNQKPPMVLRVNQLKSDRNTYLEKLSKEDIGSKPGLLVESSIILDKPCPVIELPGFKEGFISVQDEASQVVANLLVTKKGDRVLDACAAPGGKTCHLLESNPDIHLTANDKAEDRMGSIKENLERLNLKCQLTAGDLLDLSGTTFDKILLDAPCSATGIIRRHPDIKLLRRNTDIAKLCTMQARLLEAAWGLLEKGGEILYSTCSILPEENEDVVRKFIKQHDDAEVLPITLEAVLAAGIKLPIGLQLFPTIDSHDGFYYAHLRKT